MNNNETNSENARLPVSGLPMPVSEAESGEPYIKKTAVSVHITRISILLFVVCIFILVIIGQPLLPNPLQRGVPLTDVERSSGAEVKKSDAPGPVFFRRSVVSENGKRLTVIDENSRLIFTTSASPSNRTTFDHAKIAVFDAYGNVCVLDFRTAGIGETCEERVIKFSSDGVYLGELYKYVYPNTELSFEFARITDIAVHGGTLYILRSEHRGNSDENYTHTLEKTDVNAAANTKEIYSIPRGAVHPFSDAPKLTEYRTNAETIITQTDTPPYAAIDPVSGRIISAMDKPEPISASEVIEPAAESEKLTSYTETVAAGDPPLAEIAAIKLLPEFAVYTPSQVSVHVAVFLLVCLAVLAFLSSLTAPAVWLFHNRDKASLPGAAIAVILISLFTVRFVITRLDAVEDVEIASEVETVSRITAGIVNTNAMCIDISRGVFKEEALNAGARIAEYNGFCDTVRGMLAEIPILEHRTVQQRIYTVKNGSTDLLFISEQHYNTGGYSLRVQIPDPQTLSPLFTDTADGFKNVKYINGNRIGISVAAFTNAANGKDVRFAVETLYDLENIQNSRGIRNNIIIIVVVPIATLLYFTFVLVLQSRSLTRSKQDAETLAKNKSDFLAKMTHELRTPLNAIIGMSTMLAHEDMPPAAQEYTGDILKSGKNLLLLVNNILDYSKLEAHSMQLVSENYMLSDIIDNAANVIRVAAAEKKLEFIIDADANIPDKLRGDAVRIQQVLFNLLSNAVKYTDRGFLKLQVQSEPRDEHDEIMLKFSVTDSGKGIRAEDMEKLFGEFVRVDLSNNKTVEGTGLGLAIARNLCRAMGGDITVDSEYGKGSTFTMLIMQTYQPDVPFAKVEYHRGKSLLVFENKTLQAENFIRCARNLNVKCTIAKTAEEFTVHITAENWSNVLVPPSEFRRAVSAVSGTDTQIGCICGVGDSVPNDCANIIFRPFNCHTLAEFINMTPSFGGGSDYYLSNIAHMSENNDDSSETAKLTEDFIRPDLRILAVDDNKTNLTVVKGLLKPTKMQIEVCTSGKEAIQILEKSADSKERLFDAVLMDHLMPGMDGVETTKYIRRIKVYKNVPVIGLTANDDADVHKMLKQSGMNETATKPIDTDVLVGIIKKLVKSNVS